MRCWLVLATCLLLLWTLTAFVSSQGGTTGPDVKVKELSDGIELSCPAGQKVKLPSGDSELTKKLPYDDANSGEYTCVDPAENEKEKGKIFVKFRTCDNCIELDTMSVVGMVVGDVIATAVIGFAVYLFASVVRSDPVASSSKRSDRKQPAPQEVRGASNDPYQRLRFKAPKDEYDELNRKR